MKKLALFVLCFLVCGNVYADELNFKQGVVYEWSTSNVNTMTYFEIARSKPIEGAGKWNMLLDGWTLDGGVDSNEVFDALAEGRFREINSCAFVLGRKLGTLGDYLPIDFPLKDKMIITLYPMGLYIVDIWDNPNVSGCSGGAIFKIGFTF